MAERTKFYDSLEYYKILDVSPSSTEEEIRQKCQYRKWFFGHYHDNRNVTEKDLMLYEQMIRIV